MRCKTDVGGAFERPVDVVSELVAVVDCRDVIPGTERMEAVPVHQRLLRVAAVAVTVQTPSTIDDPDLEQQPILGARLLQMKPALFRLAAVRAKYRFPGECLRAGQRVDADKERIVNAVELDRLADRRVDHSRLAHDGRRMATDAIETIERPHLAVDGGGEGCAS